VRTRVGFRRGRYECRVLASSPKWQRRYDGMPQASAATLLTVVDGVQPDARSLRGKRNVLGARTFVGRPLAKRRPDSTKQAAEELGRVVEEVLPAPRRHVAGLAGRIGAGQSPRPGRTKLCRCAVLPIAASCRSSPTSAPQ
jgi:hypothetical protein